MTAEKQCPERRDKFPSRQEGEWKYRGELEDKRALFYFILLVRDKMPEN